MKHFLDQVTPDIYVTELLYIVSTGAVMLGLVAVLMIDAGLVRPKNLIDTIVQRVVCALIGGTSFMLVGYAIWNWQFYQALEVPQPFGQALHDWWLGGHYLRQYGVNLDSAIAPQADVQQTMTAFFFGFGALVASFIHGAGLERIKPQATFILGAVGAGIAMPLASYLTWGSTSYLTNAGLHDFVGAFSLYLLVGIWALVLAWRLGPRRDYTGAPGNFTLVSVGTMLLIGVLPLIVLGCGYLVPGKGYFGVAETETGLGLLFTNVFVALGGGTIGGALLAYAHRNPIYALLGPVSGYICCTALFDLVAPWQALLIALPGPFLLHLGLILVKKSGIDEPKIAPLTLGPAAYSVLVAGLVGAGRPAGGQMGIAGGSYAFQHASISFGMQILGLAIMIPAMALFAFAVTWLVEKTVGLRVGEAEEDMGLDQTYWSAIRPATADAPTPETSDVGEADLQLRAAYSPA